MESLRAPPLTYVGWAAALALLASCDAELGSFGRLVRGLLLVGACPDRGAGRQGCCRRRRCVHDQQEAGGRGGAGGTRDRRSILVLWRWPGVQGAPLGGE
eukprot:COSAG04_NODE_932_length_9350_cov_665.689007_4_plen_100_part_00